MDVTIVFPIQECRKEVGSMATRILPASCWFPRGLFLCRIYGDHLHGAGQLQEPPQGEHYQTLTVCLRCTLNRLPLGEVKECVDREEVRQKLPTSQGCLYEASVWFPQRQSRCHGLCLQMKIWPRCWEAIMPKECASSRIACFPSLGHQEAEVIRRWPSHCCAAAVTHWCGVAEGRLSVTCGVC